MSLWFVSAAILGDMLREVAMPASMQAALSSSVQAGFVVGALLSAAFGVADRFEPRLVFALCAALAALCNLLLLTVPPGGVEAIALRALTGAFLAGVYPVGMKIAVGWGEADRGLLVGLLVGGLTLGSAAPHLLAFVGGADWRTTVISASVLGLLSALLVLATRTGPFHATAARFEISAIKLAWTNDGIRRAFGGYLGHMWELFAMWAWIGVALAVSFGHHMPAETAAQWAKITTFAVIGLGALTCAVAGWLADRIGKAELTIIAMAVSGVSALLFALTFGWSVWLSIAIAVVWGMAVIPDSAQFSALVADHSPADQAGSLMTFQTALGFALTTATVQFAPVVAEAIGWPWLMASLALGPLFGIWAMWGLRKTSAR